MHPFSLSTADDPAAAIAAHARDPHLAFIAGGTDLLGLIKDRAALPERLLDINGLPDMARIEPLPNGGLRIGALARMSDVAADHGSAPAFSGDRRGAALFGVRPAAQHGVDRRQPDAADALRLFPRRGRPALQQAPARLGLLGAPRSQPQSRDIRLVRRLRRDQSLRSGSGVSGARRRCDRARHGRRTRDPVRGLSSPSRQHVGARQRAGARRPDRRDRGAR